MINGSNKLILIASDKLIIMKNKIVLSANSDWYIYNFRKNTILELKSQGYDVFILCPYGEYCSKLESLGCSVSIIRMVRKSKNPFYEFQSIYDYIKIYRSIRPDVILNFTPKANIYSALAALLYKAKVINNISGLGSAFFSKGKISFPVKLLYKFSQKCSDHVFFQNNDDLDLFVKNKIIPINKTSRIPGSGVDLEKFSLQTRKNDGDVNFILVARMLWEKGVQYFVDVARLVKKDYPNANFFLLGAIDDGNPHGISQEQINNWANEGIIVYLGVTDSVESVLREMDAMVLPSYYREGVPKSLLEAGALGKIIITSDNVGCRDTVDDGINGYLCKSKDLESLYEAVLKTLKLSYDQRLKMGQNGRKKMEKEFSEKIVLDEYLKKIREMLC